MEKCTDLTTDLEQKLDEADRYAAESAERYSVEEVFSRVRARIQENEEL